MWLVLMILAAQPGTVVVKEARVRITHPAHCRLAPIDEPGRAGSVAAWSVTHCAQGPLRRTAPGFHRIAEIQFHTAESIRRFDEACLKATGRLDDDRCWEGWRPHLANLAAERQAISRRVCPPSDECEFRESHGTRFLVRGLVLDNACRISREFVAYLGDTRVSFGVLLPDAGEEGKRRAGALFTEFRFSQ